jgi:hypothetical protein
MPIESEIKTVAQNDHGSSLRVKNRSLRKMRPLYIENVQ